MVCGSPRLRQNPSQLLARQRLLLGQSQKRNNVSSCFTHKSGENHGGSQDTRPQSATQVLLPPHDPSLSCRKTSVLTCGVLKSPDLIILHTVLSRCKEEGPRTPSRRPRQPRRRTGERSACPPSARSRPRLALTFLSWLARRMPSMMTLSCPAARW